MCLACYGVSSLMCLYRRRYVPISLQRESFVGAARPPIHVCMCTATPWTIKSSYCARHTWGRFREACSWCSILASERASAGNRACARGSAIATVTLAHWLCSDYRKGQENRLSNFVQSLAAKVLALQSKQFEASFLVDRANTLTASIQSCQYEQTAMVAALDGLRDVVRAMASAGLSNVASFARSLDEKVSWNLALALCESLLTAVRSNQVESLLVQRLQSALTKWTSFVRRPSGLRWWCIFLFCVWCRACGNPEASQMVTCVCDTMYK